ncbi:MAG: tetratricopeptide repeat protein [Candidatus Competibacteraceae bacterium]
MEQYTDDERVEDLKKWWKENGSSIIAGIVLGLIAIFGWQYWSSYRNTQAERASQAYDVFVVAVEKPDADQARQRGQALLTDFPKSPYAALAALRLAKLAVENGDNAAATQQLGWVISNARLDELKDIARLRLARVLLTAGQPAEAEKTLEQVTTATLNAEREELKGDLYLAGNNPAKARTAYATAQAASGGNSLLQLKLDNLSIPTPETVVTVPPTPPTAAPPVSVNPTEPTITPPADNGTVSTPPAATSGQ